MAKEDREEDREDEQVIPPVETEEEEDAEEDEEEESEEEDDSEQDIDFEKELEALEAEGASEAEQSTPRAGKTEEEKAGHTVRETIKRLKRKGKDDDAISKIVGFKVVTEEADEDDEDEDRRPADSSFVTKKDLDLREANTEAGRLARSEAEKKVILWYVQNKNLSVADAHLLANKGRLKRNVEELRRAGDSRPAAPAAAGRRDEVEQKPRFTRAEMETMQRRGMKWNPKTQQMEGKFTFVKLDPKTGERITGRLAKPNK